MTGFLAALGQSSYPSFLLFFLIFNSFVWGSFSLAGALALVAGMSSQVATASESGGTPSKAISGVGIFSIFLFGWIFSFVYTPNQSLYCTEVLNLEIRAKGISLHALESNLVTILFTYSTSIALGDISWSECLYCPILRVSIDERTQNITSFGYRSTSWPASYGFYLVLRPVIALVSSSGGVHSSQLGNADSPYLQSKSWIRVSTHRFHLKRAENVLRL